MVKFKSSTKRFDIDVLSTAIVMPKRAVAIKKRRKSRDMTLLPIFISFIL